MGCYVCYRLPLSSPLLSTWPVIRWLQVIGGTSLRFAGSSIHGIPVSVIVLRKYRTAVCDHGKPAERFLLNVVVVGLVSIIRTENAQCKLQVYGDEYVDAKSHGALGKAANDDLDDVYNNELDEGDWTTADFASIPEGAVAGRVRKLWDCFCRLQQVRQKADADLPHNL